jgi:hypothetical protein
MARRPAYTIALMAFGLSKRQCKPSERRDLDVEVMDWPVP